MIRRIAFCVFLLAAAGANRAQTFAGRSGSDVFVTPPFRFCLGDDNGSQTCIVQSEANVAKIINGGFDLARANKTVSTLPAAATNTGRAYRVIDGTSSSDCTSGGGTTSTICFSDGTQWKGLGGGVNSQAPTSSLQKSNGAGGLSARGVTDDSTNLAAARDSQFKGANPWVDIRAFGARSFPGSFTGPITTASMRSGSAVVTLTSGASFQNGDGVTIVGAGTTLSLSTPSAPTVVPSITRFGSGMNIAVADGGTGATTYCYQIVARTTNGQLTPGSKETCTTTGQASLGPVKPIKISSYTRSGQTVTITTASAHTLVPNAMVRITGADISIGGNWNVSTVPDSTHFTITTASDSAAGAPTVGGAGGAVTWYNVNHISWSAVTNAYQYYIYGRVSGGTKTLIGISYPQNNGFIGFNTHNTWDDYGPTSMGPAPTAPNWVPTTVPAVGKNGNLTTTIVSGGGTNTVTLANAAANTVAGANFQFDNGPAFLAAANAVFGNGVVHIPVGNFPIYSFISLPTAQAVSVMQVGQLVLEDTIQFNKLVWSGRAIQNNIPAASFDWQPMTRIFGTTAYPMFYSPFGNGNSAFSYVSLFNNSFNGMIYLQDAGSIPTSSFDHVQWHTGSGAAQNDYLGLAFVARGNTPNGGASNWSFTDCTFAAGLNNNVISDTPIFYSSVTGMPFHLNNVQFAVRGMSFDTGTNGAQVIIDNLYNQGPVMPLVNLFSTRVNKPVYQLENRGAIVDSATMPIVNYFGFPPTGSISFSNFIGNLGTVGPVAGPGGVNVISRMGTASVGGVGYEAGPSTLTSVDGINSRDNLDNPIKQFGASVSIDANRAFYVNSLATAAPTCSVRAGGSVALNTYQAAVAPVFAHRGEGSLSQRSAPCTTTRGNQTLTINWTAVPGAIGYNIYFPNTNQSLQASAEDPLVSGGATTSFVWTNQGVIGEGVKAAGGGPTEATRSAVYSNSFVLPGLNGSSANGFVTIDAPTATASRQFHLPDDSGYPALAFYPKLVPNIVPMTNSSGQIISTVAPMNVYDSGVWPNGSLPATNADWTTPSGTNPVNYSGNTFVSSSGSYNLAVYTGATFAPDNQWASVRVANPASTSNSFAWAAVRMFTSANTWYGCGINKNTNFFECRKTVAGTGTPFSGSFAYTPVVGDVWAINANGTTITGYLNGVPVIRVTDSSIAPGGAPGIAFFNNSGLALSHFLGSQAEVSLNKAQTWTQLQTYSAGVSLTEGSNPSGAANSDVLSGNSIEHTVYQNLNNGGAQPVPKRGIVTSRYTNAATTASNISGLSFTVSANANYTMRCELYYQGSAATAGLDITITGPASPTNVFYSYDEYSGAGAVNSRVANSFGTKLVGNATITETTNLHAIVTLGLMNGANAGTVRVQGSATGTGTVTVQPGSFCQVQ